MADTSNLSKFLSDVADAIRTKKETIDTIPAKDFDTEILSIETGIDTSDATAAADNIENGYTAYVNGEKISGTITTSLDTIITAGSDATITDTGEALTVDRGYGKKIILKSEQQLRSTIPYETIASMGGVTSDKIVSGNTIFGIEGTGSGGIDTSDATATVEDIVSPKTAYVNGEKLVGVLEVGLTKDKYDTCYDLTQTILGKRSCSPDDFDFLEYIESTGTQRIELPMLNYTDKRGPLYNLKYDIQFPELDIRPSGLSLWHLEGVGSGGNYTNSLLYVGWKQYNGNEEPTTMYFYFANTVKSDVATEVEADTNRHVFEVVTNSPTKSQGLYMDNILVKENNSTKTYTKFKAPFYLFGYDTSSFTTMKNYNKTRLYNFQILDTSDTVLFNLYPVRRKTDGELGLYDMITGQFLTNDGNGEFLYKEKEV